MEHNRVCVLRFFPISYEDQFCSKKSLLCNEDKLYNLSVTLVLLHMEDYNQTQCRILKVSLFALEDTILSMHFQVSLDHWGIEHELSLLHPLLGCLYCTHFGCVNVASVNAKDILM